MLENLKRSWPIATFFVIIIAIVFQQISTSFVEQNMASGGPYDNAASYPRIVAIMIGLLLIVQLLMKGNGFNSSDIPEGADKKATLRAILLIGIFGIYIYTLKFLGYQIGTPLMIFSVTLLCGDKRYFRAAIFAILASLSIAFVFEQLLNVVLPGGFLRIHIPW